MAPPIAMCPRCVVPVVMTMAFSHAEFYCLDCGAHLGFLSPVAADVTDRLLEQLAARKAEFEQLGGADLIAPFSYHRDCASCSIATRESHDMHGTDEERARHDAALIALERRVRAHR